MLCQVCGIPAHTYVCMVFQDFTLTRFVALDILTGLICSDFMTTIIL